MEEMALSSRIGGGVITRLEARVDGGAAPPPPIRRVASDVDSQPVPCEGNSPSELWPRLPSFGIACLLLWRRRHQTYPTRQSRRPALSAVGRIGSSSGWLRSDVPSEASEPPRGGSEGGVGGEGSGEGGEGCEGGNGGAEGGEGGSAGGGDGRGGGSSGECNGIAVCRTGRRPPERRSVARRESCAHQLLGNTETTCPQSFLPAVAVSARCRRSSHGRLSPAATPRKLLLSLAMAAALLALHSALAAHPESAWDERVDPACCPYPEHDPRDYNWPYSHFQYSEVIPDVTGSFVPMTELNISFPSGVVADYGKPIPPSLLERVPQVLPRANPNPSPSLNPSPNLLHGLEVWLATSTSRHSRHPLRLHRRRHGRTPRRHRRHCCPSRRRRLGSGVRVRVN